MAAAFPHSRFTGYDLSAEAIERARAEARERGLANVRFEVRDVADLDAARRASTWSPPSTRSTTRRGPAAVLAGDRRARCAPTASS